MSKKELVSCWNLLAIGHIYTHFVLTLLLKQSDIPAIDTTATIKAIITKDNSGIKGVDEDEEVGPVVLVGIEFGEFDDVGSEEGAFVGDVGDAVDCEEMGVPVIWIGTALRVLVKQT